MINSIKYLIEEYYAFNPSEITNNTKIDPIIHQEIIDNAIYEYCPKTREELIELIKERFEQQKGNKIYDINLNDICTSYIVDMSYLFEFCEETYLPPVKLDMSDWNVSHVNDMCDMFSSIPEVIEINLSGWDVSNVTHMDNMFAYCTHLEKLNLDGWNVANVQFMRGMFKFCYDKIIPDWYDKKNNQY